MLLSQNLASSLWLLALIPCKRLPVEPVPRILAGKLFVLMKALKHGKRDTLFLNWKIYGYNPTSPTHLILLRIPEGLHHHQVQSQTMTFEVCLLYYRYRDALRVISPNNLSARLYCYMSARLIRLNVVSSSYPLTPIYHPRPQIFLYLFRLGNVFINQQRSRQF